MKEQLINKLHSYPIQNHLDLLISMQEDHRLSHYLENKVESVMELNQALQAESRPAYAVEALHMEELTRDLRPSRFEYVRVLLIRLKVKVYCAISKEHGFAGHLSLQIINYSILEIKKVHWMSRKKTESAFKLIIILTTKIQTNEKSTIYNYFYRRIFLYRFCTN